MMFLFLVSTFAILTCAVLIFFLKFSSDKQHHQQQTNDIQVDAVTFLRSVKSTKPFPISSALGWKVYSLCTDTRIWRRNIIVDNGGNRVQILGCYVKLPAPVQVASKVFKDVTQFVEWRPGVESTSACVNGSSKEYRNVSHDLINIVTANQKLSKYSVVVEQQNIERFWKREDNGCFWMLESGDRGLLLYILQPVEDVDCCCLTIVSHFTFPVTLQDSATTISSYAQSIKDYMFYRKMKVTPLLNFHIPQNVAVIGAKEAYDRTVVTSTGMDDLLDSSTYSSSDDENSDSFYKKFEGLHPREKHKILQKSNFILHVKSHDQRLRSQSDTNTGDVKTNIVKQRSSTLPKDVKSCRTDQHKTSTKSLDLERKVHNEKIDLDSSKSSIDDNVFIDDSTKDMRNTQNESQILPKSDNTQSSVIPQTLPPQNGALNTRNNVPSSNKESISKLPHILEKEPSDDAIIVPQNKNQDTEQNNGAKKERVSGMDSDHQNRSEDQNVKPQTQLLSSPDDIRYMTLANQSAADLLGEYFQVSNIDLKKPVNQQTAISGGWGFCGLENDVVILKKTPADGSNIFSYMGKGLIHASPQTVLETVKNPRTKFTYDETLKKVDVLNDVTKKIKIVYFYHEVINMFKKSCYDFCVLQTERQDGDKFVLANSSVEYGLPVPVGVQRAQMYPSGWVIEPVQKEKKIYSMATYIIQVDFGTAKNSMDKPPVDELVSKQALSIAYLRQFLKPAKWISRQQSSPVPRQQPSPTPRNKSSTSNQQSSPAVRQRQVTAVSRTQSNPVT
ncbi:uncharacterized protein LOC127738975 [Mytilus californianus]|uniref:uncharacterized protein LOC127738975 n=1 Tax=Mytilus californianus TaxID=6549 RepID=UPI0022464502|nr:uncharacterized protein LOC127738975 [Mytilus californianus]